MIHARWALAGLLLLGAGCSDLPDSEASRRERNAAVLDLQDFVILGRPPVIALDGRGDILTARSRTALLDPESLGGRTDAVRVQAHALPWLSGSAEGRAFLSLPAPRVVVRGVPARQCPVARVSGGPEAPDLPSLVVRTLRACVAGAPVGCGCQVVALDDLVLSPREDLAYATGVAARLRLERPRMDRLLVAEEVGPDRTMLRDLTGPVADLTIGPDGTARIVFAADGPAYAGVARSTGYRRGRRTWVVDAADPETGARLRLLIGFEPDEMAASAGALLAWGAVR